MTEEKQKIVIVIGAGASADFDPKNFCFPAGENLIKLIGNKEKITKIFWNEICESFRNIVLEKINKNDQSLINLHNIFCDFLINKDYSRDNTANLTGFSFFEIANAFTSHLKNHTLQYRDKINFLYEAPNIDKLLKANLYFI